ncbi:MAG: hypothetical protein NTZ07_00495 [Candidatus Woesebacteria bacterium]|jgi:hypothetical protein|nr:hypothetical protein [Candidatus Woesebacteria bacterium]
MDGRSWTGFNAGVVTVLFGVMALVFKLAPIWADVLAVIAGGILVIFTGKPVLKAISRRVKPRFKHQ